VLVGGGGESKTLRLVAKHADIWHGFCDPDFVERKVAVLDEWCATESRDPAEIERSVGVKGSPDETGQRLHDLGVRLFTVSAGGPDYDLGQARDWMAWRDDVNAS
jgi:alkanesulfonate monooxygenase SsuD/methylene tetrahydromethanopterin reductase-like flavin-dependent oxidoreductase (luciferase family)